MCHKYPKIILKNKHMYYSSGYKTAKKKKKNVSCNLHETGGDNDKVMKYHFSVELLMWFWGQFNNTV